MPFDFSKPYTDTGGYSWTFDSPAFRYDEVSGGNVANPSAPQNLGDQYYRSLGYQGPISGATGGGDALQGEGSVTPELTQWLNDQGYHWGYGVGPGSTYSGGYFDSGGQPVNKAGFASGQLNDPVKFALATLGIGGFGALAAAGGGAAAGAAGSATGGGAFLGEGVASGVPAWDAAGGVAAGGAASGGAAAGGTGVSGIMSQLGGPSGISSLLRGAGSVLGGLYGYNKTAADAKLPTMDEYLASPMFKAGEQAVTRSRMAQGYQGSGNMMHALADNAQLGYEQFAKLKAGQQAQAGTLASTQMSNLGLISGGLGTLLGQIPGLMGGTASGSSAVLPGGSGTLGFPDVSSIWGGP